MTKNLYTMFVLTILLLYLSYLDAEVDIGSILTNSVFRLQVGTSEGTGFLVKESGETFLVSAGHMLSKELPYPKSVAARLTQIDEDSWGASYYDLIPLIAVNAGEWDVAIFKFKDGAPLESVPLKLYREGSFLGKEVLAIGCSTGYAPRATFGYVGFAYSLGLEFSADVSYGCSGGPLILKDTGEVIGIISRIGLSGSNEQMNLLDTKDLEFGRRFPVYHVGFASPISQARSLIEALTLPKKILPMSPFSILLD